MAKFDSYWEVVNYLDKHSKIWKEGKAMARMRSGGGRPYAESEHWLLLRNNKLYIVSIHQDWSDVYNPETDQIEYNEYWYYVIEPVSEKEAQSYLWDEKYPLYHRYFSKLQKVI